MAARDSRLGWGEAVKQQDGFLLTGCALTEIQLPLVSTAPCTDFMQYQKKTGSICHTGCPKPSRGHKAKDEHFPVPVWKQMQSEHSC
jgi:hypothetical protein